MLTELLPENYPLVTHRTDCAAPPCLSAISAVNEPALMTPSPLFPARRGVQRARRKGLTPELLLCPLTKPDARRMLRSRDLVLDFSTP